MLRALQVSVRRRKVCSVKRKRGEEQIRTAAHQWQYRWVVQPAFPSSHSTTAAMAAPPAANAACCCASDSNPFPIHLPQALQLLLLLPSFSCRLPCHSPSSAIAAAAAATAACCCASECDPCGDPAPPGDSACVLGHGQPRQRGHDSTGAVDA